MTQPSPAPPAAHGRNHSFDVLRLLLAFFIVYTHTHSRYRFELDPITNSAVPAFFMLSGYFMMAHARQWHKMLGAARRMIVTMVVWTAVSYVVICWYRGRPATPGPTPLAMLAAINVDPFVGHLWYLSAYAYVLVAVAWLAGRNWLTRKAMALIICLPFIVYFAVEGIYWHNGWDSGFNEIVAFRHWLVPGLPCFLIGGIIARRNLRLRPWAAAALVAVLGAAAMAEIHVLKIRHISDTFFMTIPLAVSLILLANSVHLPHPNILSECGRRYSLHIYLVHPLLCLYVLADELYINPSPALFLLSPYLIFVLALAVSIAIYRAKQIKFIPLIVSKLYK